MFLLNGVYFNSLTILYKIEILFKRPMPSTTLCALCKQMNIIIKMYLDRKIGVNRI